TFMRETVRKGVALGFGLAAASKEQAEKIIDELVKKGELSQQESKDFLSELLRRGEESKKELDEKIQSKLKEMLSGLNVATKEEVQALEKRLAQLENERKQSE
ncbi:phasin family protein, partial [Halalkalibacterium halodurans]|uniref:phasin family protein n=1 Tax=Halalkalibacterium halodurans TaxID=86665 RepID=UPI002AA9D38D